MCYVTVESGSFVSILHYELCNCALCVAFMLLLVLKIYVLHLSVTINSDAVTVLKIYVAFICYSSENICVAFIYFLNECTVRTSSIPVICYVLQLDHIIVVLKMCCHILVNKIDLLGNNRHMLLQQDCSVYQSSTCEPLHCSI